MVQLPPDLARVGDELAAAATRSLAARRRRRRRLLGAGTSLVAAAVVAVGVLSTTSGGGLDGSLGQESLAAVIARPPERRPVVTSNTRTITHRDTTPAARALIIGRMPRS